MAQDLDEVIKQHETTNGNFEEVGRLGQAMKHVLRQGKNWEDLPAASKEALDMATMYIARILAGNPGEKKHWTGAASYLWLRSEQMTSLEESVTKVVQDNHTRNVDRLSPLRRPFAKPPAVDEATES